MKNSWHVPAAALAGLKAAVDSKGSSGFASEPGPKAAFDSVKDDYVGFGYVALRPLLDWSNDLNKARGLSSMRMAGKDAPVSETSPTPAIWDSFC